MTDLYSIEKYRLESEKIVREDVVFCHSSLVSDLAQNSEACTALGLDWEGEILPLCQRYDYEEHARENIIPDMDAEECWEWLKCNAELPSPWESADVDQPEEFTDDETEILRNAVIQTLDESDDWQEFCEDQRSEPDAQEAFEHWHVSEWLGSRLAEQGEIVGSLYGMTIWGRCTSGQAISMDEVMLRIARDMVDERERYETTNKG